MHKVQELNKRYFLFKIIQLSIISKFSLKNIINHGRSRKAEQKVSPLFALFVLLSSILFFPFGVKKCICLFVNKIYYFVNKIFCLIHYILWCKNEVLLSSDHDNLIWSYAVLLQIFHILMTIEIENMNVISSTNSLVLYVLVYMLEVGLSSQMIFSRSFFFGKLFSLS